VVYPVLFIDAVNVKIRDGQVANRTVHIALAVTADGCRDILGLWAGDGGEGAKHWLQVLTELRNRGVHDVLMLVCDGLKGLPEARSSRRPSCKPAWSTSFASFLDGSDDRVRHLQRRSLVLEVQLQRLTKVRQRLLERLPLTRHLDLEAPRHVQVALLGDGGGHVQCGLSHVPADDATHALTRPDKVFGTHRLSGPCKGRDSQTAHLPFGAAPRAGCAAKRYRHPAAQ
jgi:hypothetical protein